LVSITDNDLLFSKIRFYRIYPSYFYVDPKSTFAVLATLYLCFINKDAAYFFLSPAFVCFENGIHHLSL